MYGQRSILEELKNEFRSGNVLTQLIIINVAMFIAINFVHLILFLSMGDRMLAAVKFDEVLSWLMIPADFMKLITRPWTIITHMFAHQGFFHLLFNMLWLYWFGRILRDLTGNKMVLPLYILGGLAGAALLIVSYNVFPVLAGELPYAKALGASAGVMAIVIGTATLAPDYVMHLILIGPVRLKYIALFTLLLDVIGIPGPNTGGHIAHLGGALLGFVLVKQMQRGNDWSISFHNFTNAVIAAFKPQNGPRMAYKNKKGKTTQATRKTSKANFSKQEKIDQILDKISQSGYDSLTAEEKAFLFKASGEDNDS